MISRNLVAVVLLAGGLQYVFKIRKFLDWDKTFFKHAPGPCTTVMTEGGSEDLTHIGNGLFILTSGFNLDGNPGNIRMLDVNGREPQVHVLNITNAPTTENFLAGPHGIATWRDPKSGALTVYVVTHPPNHDKIEVFSLVGTRYLRHIRTIMDPLFKFMNDLVIVGPDQFYITKFWTFRDRLKIYIDILALNWGEVHYYDGHRARVVAKGLYLPNGINISPDGNTVYVADCADKYLIGYRRDKTTNSLDQIWSYNMDTVIDNIEVEDQTGDLWIGCHPLMYTRLDLFNLFNFLHPSQVIKVSMNNGMVSDVVEVYADDGREIAGTSIAGYYNGKLAIGSVDAQMIVCDIK